MPSRKIQALSAALQPLAREFMIRCVAEGIPVIITCTLRSNQEQTDLYALGRTVKSHVGPWTPEMPLGRTVTNAKAGESKHNTGDAFDVGLLDANGDADWDDSNPHWLRMGEIGEEVGLNWGGRWPGKKRDLPHFQLG